MTAHRFFRIVWRVNAIVLLLAGAAAVVVLAIAAAAMSGEVLRERRGGPVVKIAGERIGSMEFGWGSFELMAGTAVLRMPLTSYESYAFASSGGSSSTRNYLFYDSDTHQAHWLVEGNEKLITWTCDLKAGPEPRESKVLGSLYSVVESDSDHDGKLTASDLSWVLLTDPTGARQARILEKVSSAEGCEVLPHDSAVLFYVSKGELRAATLDLSGLKVAVDTSLAALPPKAASN